MIVNCHADCAHGLLFHSAKQPGCYTHCAGVLSLLGFTKGLLTSVKEIFSTQLITGVRWTKTSNAEKSEVKEISKK